MTVQELLEEQFNIPGTWYDSIIIHTKEQDWWKGGYFEYNREADEHGRVQPKTKEDLKRIMYNTTYANGLNCDLNFIDTSKITDMSSLFVSSKFNGDISKWDVSHVEDMASMFLDSSFNGDISKWDVSNAEDMSYMFRYSKFNGDISKWNVSKVKNMRAMFKDCPLENKPQFQPKF